MGVEASRDVWRTVSEAKSPEFRPFRSAEARDRYLARYDATEKSWPVPFESRTVETDHGTTFARISGPSDALPLVLLPGGQSSSLVWRRLIEPLSARFRTYALDAIYDAGRSVPSRPMKDINGLMAWLDDVLDASQSYLRHRSRTLDTGGLHGAERDGAGM
jgi:pimeloyl-ACP methyl ester carboxylesterase